jgi:enolase
MQSMIPRGKFEIESVMAREILDSRGDPTVEAEVRLSGGAVGRASVPSGASVGINEVVELRDNNKRFHGKGTTRAVRNINEVIGPALRGKDAREQEEVDEIMIKLDGTPQKSKLGGNAILAVSVAVLKAAATASNRKLYEYVKREEDYLLPVPLMNVINGGKHAGNELRIQEFMIIPAGFDSFPEALRAGVEIYHSLKGFLKSNYGTNAINVGDEGGFAPPMKRTIEALDALTRAIELAGYHPGADVFLGIDAAASNFLDPKTNKYTLDNKALSSYDLLQFYKNIVEQYPVRSIEDPFHEEDFEAFVTIEKELGGKVQIVGDDIFTTNISRVSKGVRMGAANALLFKLNQVGTITEAFETFDLAKKSGWNVIVSHRSGETEDTYIADISVGKASGQIKTGAPCRGERTAKYNQLLRICEELTTRAGFSKVKFFS